MHRLAEAGPAGHVEIPSDAPEKAEAFYGAVFDWKFQHVPGMGLHALHDPERQRRRGTISAPSAWPRARQLHQRRADRALPREDREQRGQGHPPGHGGSPDRLVRDRRRSRRKSLQSLAPESRRPRPLEARDAVAPERDPDVDPLGSSPRTLGPRRFPGSESPRHAAIRSPPPRAPRAPRPSPERGTPASPRDHLQPSPAAVLEARGHEGEDPASLRPRDPGADLPWRAAPSAAGLARWGTPMSTSPRPPWALTPGAEDAWLDMSEWTWWWELNKEIYLQLRARQRAGDAASGSDGFFLGRGQKEQAIEIDVRPTREQIRGEIVPALLRLLATERAQDVKTSCLVALARIGEDGLLELKPSSSRVIVATSATTTSRWPRRPLSRSASWVTPLRPFCSATWCSTPSTGGRPSARARYPFACGPLPPTPSRC